MKEEQTTSHTKKQYTILVLVAITIIAVVGSGIMFYKYRQSQNTEQARQKRLVAQLSETIDLPEDSSPTIVTVADKAKLTNKTLAERVKNQDMLIIYGSSKRIIVYRPSTKKVIDMFSFSSQAAATDSVSTQSKAKQ